jgi:hypothetical protein
VKFAVGPVVLEMSQGLTCATNPVSKNPNEGNVPDDESSICQLTLPTIAEIDEQAKLLNPLDKVSIVVLRIVLNKALGGGNYYTCFDGLRGDSPKYPIGLSGDGVESCEDWKTIFHITNAKPGISGPPWDYVTLHDIEWPTTIIFGSSNINALPVVEAPISEWVKGTTFLSDVRVGSIMETSTSLPIDNFSMYSQVFSNGDLTFTKAISMTREQYIRLNPTGTAGGVDLRVRNSSSYMAYVYHSASIIGGTRTQSIQIEAYGN